ncbi:MAG: sugar phosphate isomerase/epimerase [Chloroflexi bacterium]|nr:sugar phosphate isomerase/epimerase [Chloroflexota bacterium]
MATPESTLREALDLFAALGLDGIEIICADDYPCGLTLATTQDELNSIRQGAADAGLLVAGLVPYTKDMNSAEAQARSRAVAELKRVIDIAVALDCPAIRVFGGHEVAASDQGIALNWLAESLRELGEYAASAGLQLNIENHMDTMATSAEMTMAIVRAVDLPNVGVLYDQANLAFMNSEVYEMAIALQGPRVQHVHVKDFFWHGTDRIAAVVGHGIVPWKEIVNSLTRIGYEGFYSLEYERRWYPDQLPPPAIGMKQSLDFLRGTNA